MIESFVDLTYRGLSLGKRIKLAQVRPRSGYLELAAPMPVGSAIALATDDGMTIDATVTWVYEQVAGSDRSPGMVVTPALTGDAAAWWQARVALPDDDTPRARRTRPVTLRPRSQTLQTPPPADAVAAPASTAAPAAPAPSAAAELAARVAAAAGVAPPPPVHNAPISATGGAVLPALDPSPMAPIAPTGREPGMRSTGEHAVVDDGNMTMIMTAIDPTEITASDLPLGTSDGTIDQAIAADATTEVSAANSDGTDGDGDDATEPPPTSDGAPPASRGGRKRKRRR